MDNDSDVEPDLREPDWAELGLERFPSLPEDWAESERDWFPDVPADWSDFSLSDRSIDWQEAGVCAQTDPAVFFLDKGGRPASAKNVCAVCPVQARCLRYALENAEPFGIWGGLTEMERRPLLREHRGRCRREGCDNLRGFRSDGQLRKYCSDQCHALARIEGRHAAA